MNWILFALLTVVTWGVYGVLLHMGQSQMLPSGTLDAEARYKSFLFVGLAYFLVAVLAPLALLMMQGKAFSGYRSEGMFWSLIAGITGAIGAFGVLLAFGAGGKPYVVMSIIFAGAPIVNVAYSFYNHPPKDGWASIKPQFVLGIVLAAVGGYLVTYHRPDKPAPKPAAATATASPIKPGA
ncbi:MAG: hypothetical protein HYR88_00840 [Verrucomicrobia bacterium]|nr:hypothetical protein [Verrucomicrobiota bacterium]MBI3870314.1 hypothetical protein [Verrucomicrobiota bacterium]